MLSGSLQGEAVEEGPSMDELVARETVDLLPYVSWEKDVIEEKVKFSRR